MARTLNREERKAERRRVWAQEVAWRGMMSQGFALETAYLSNDFLTPDPIMDRDFWWIIEEGSK